MTRTTISQRHKLLAATTLAGLCATATVAAFPAGAGAFGTKGFRDGHSTKGSHTQPAISPAPGHANKEWFVTSGDHRATILAISTSGRVSRVSATSAAGSSTAPAYGSVVADGYDWLVRYDQASSPLYAVAPDGKVKQVLANVGSGITDLTAGPQNTLDFSSSDQSVGIQSCAVTSGPAVSCAQPFSLAGLLTTLTGFISGQGQIDSIASEDGRLWFTDSTGQLGAFNLVAELTGGLGTVLSDLFQGPYGDSGSGAGAVGEASAAPNTIAADRNGYLYVAGGQFTSSRSRNTRILKINPATGQTVKTYGGLSNVTAVTAGPGSNVWFLDKSSSGRGHVGELNVRSGKITQRTLPAGYRFEPRIAEIAPGPAGTGTLYFTLQTRSGGAAIGEVTGA